VLILPSGRKTRVQAITIFDGDLNSAGATEAVTLRLADEIDIIRGDTIAAIDNPPLQSHFIAATAVWLSETPAQLGARYRLKHTTRQETAELKSIEYRININTLAHDSAHTLEMNEIGFVHLETVRPIIFDPYTKNRTTGSFILIDPATNATVAAGLIAGSYHGATPTGGIGFEWRFQDGALIISTDDPDRKLELKAQGAAADSEPVLIDDPEALEALQHLLRRLKLLVPDQATSEQEGDFSI
jgi:sulfate adenylyltransferase subunit 1 (EFTu-like GTPase family)